MKKHLVTAGVLLVFFVGLAVLLYPYIADYFNSQRQSRVVSQYYRNLATLSDDDFSELFAAAHAYNDSLEYRRNQNLLTEEELEEYMGLLNPFGNGIMGTLMIDAINVMLPIYHGTNEGVLQIGAGHYEGTSLPVGGPGTHTVITGHRGLPSSLLLTNLDRVVIGDIFVLRILNETLTYRVDQIVTILPHELDELAFVPGRDLCTLVTCTPYGINSHRLLVRGYRIDNLEEEKEFIPQVYAEAEAINDKLVALIVFSPAIIVVAVYLIVQFRRIFGRRGLQ